jgi:hypothetical protein
MQGAGRVRADKAALAKILALPSAISLGEQNLSTKKSMVFSIQIKNISTDTMTVSPKFRARAKGIQMLEASKVTIAAGESQQIQLRFKIDASSMTALVQEMDGFVTLEAQNGEEIAIPVLVVAKRVSAIKAQSLVVHSSKEDAAGSAADLTVKNSGQNSGDVLIFNLLGFDPRKENPQHSSSVNTACDLQSVGYRIVDKDVDGVNQTMLQVAAKVYQAQTTWNGCDVSVLFDNNGDQIEDQELVGTTLSNVPGLAGPTNGGLFSSLLMDSVKSREVRRTFEQAIQSHDKKATEDYKGALLNLGDMLALDHTTVAVVEVPVEKLTLTQSGELSIRVVTTLTDDSTALADDFLNKKAWMKISLEKTSQGYVDMPEKITINAGQEKTISLTKGFGNYGLMVLMPNNANVLSDLVRDGQAQLVHPQFRD